MFSLVINAIMVLVVILFVSQVATLVLVAPICVLGCTINGL
jgi:di/tricarboxylate transporter